MQGTNIAFFHGASPQYNNKYAIFLPKILCQGAYAGRI